MRRAAWFMVLSLSCALIEAADPAKSVPVEQQDFSRELPRIPATEPADALKTIKVQSGFRVEQVAAEPLVNSPVALAWDENARLFVVEMRGYSENRDEAISRVSLLVDSDGDGRYDRSTIYADKLLWPTAIACWQGGVFVADAPHIYYMKDTNGDGRADERQIVFTGFSTSNVQGLLNSLTWTLDNRIHGSASSTGGDITRPDTPQFKSVNVRGRDFEIEPRSRQFVATSGGAQHGMSFDVWGHKFVCSNSNHIQQVMFEDRYVARNPFFNAPSAKENIATDGPQAEVFRSSPVEPWRIVRTRLRVSGAVKGMVEGGGRAAGYFTGATGVTIYRGDAFPQNLWGMAVIGDVGSNLVHRKQLVLGGVQFSASRMDKESEFVASTDIWFRPAQFANGPDGALYIADVYREVIEHPASIPPMIKKHLDLTHGRDRGRVYRVVPSDYQQRPLPQLGQATTAQLVELLAHSNAWQRETAARLLYERQDPAAVEPLVKLAATSVNPLGRMHALYALDGLGQLQSSAVIRALGDESPRVREHAVRLAERVLKQSPSVADKLITLAGDDDAQVRYQLAFTLGELPTAASRAALLQLVKRDRSDRWMRVAFFSSLATGADDTWQRLVDDADFRRDPNGRAILAQLATQIALENQSDTIRRVVDRLNTLVEQDSPLVMAHIRGLSEGLLRRGRPLREVLGTSSGGAGDLLQRLVTSAQQSAGNEQAKAADRVESIQTLALSTFAETHELFAKLLSSRQPQEVQHAAIVTLDKFNDPKVGELLLTAWPTLSPRLKSPAADALFARVDRLKRLLIEAEKGEFPLAELEPPRVQLLLSHKDPAIQSHAKKLLANLKVSKRQDVVEAYRGALKLAGESARGKQLFGKVCSVCHRLENVGTEIGPNLSAMKNRGAEAILLNVLDPSREVNPQFLNYICLTSDGRALTGVLAAETATSVTLRRAENQQDQVLRINIDELRSTGLSIMPEGIEKQVDVQGMADLIAYLMQVP